MPEIEQTGVISKFLSQYAEDTIRAVALEHQQKAAELLNRGEVTQDDLDSVIAHTSEAKKLWNVYKEFNVLSLGFLGQLAELGLVEPSANYLHRVAPQTGISSEVPPSTQLEPVPASSGNTTLEPETPESKTESESDMDRLKSKLGHNLTEMTRSVVTAPTVPLGSVKQTTTPVISIVEQTPSPEQSTLEEQTKGVKEQEQSSTVETSKLSPSEKRLFDIINTASASGSNLTINEIAQQYAPVGTPEENAINRTSSALHRLRHRGVSVEFKGNAYFIPQKKVPEVLQPTENPNVEVVEPTEITNNNDLEGNHVIVTKEQSTPSKDLVENQVARPASKEERMNTTFEFKGKKYSGIKALILRELSATKEPLTTHQLSERVTEEGLQDGIKQVHARLNELIKELNGNSTQLEYTPIISGNKRAFGYSLPSSEVRPPIEHVSSGQLEEGKQVIFSEELPASQAQQSTEELDMTIFDLSPEEWKEEGKKQNGHTEEEIIGDETDKGRKYLTEEEAKKVLGRISQANHNTYYMEFRPYIMEQLGVTSEEADVFFAEVMTYHPDEFRKQWERQNKQIRTDVSGILDSEIGIRKGKALSLFIENAEMPEEEQGKGKKKSVK